MLMIYNKESQYNCTDYWCYKFLQVVRVNVMVFVVCDYFIP